MNLIERSQQKVKVSLGEYKRALETDSFVFFVDFKQSDDNSNTLMYVKSEFSLELVCSDYFALSKLLEALITESDTWISEELKCERESLILLLREKFGYDV